jgi:hypothetical protein
MTTLNDIIRKKTANKYAGTKLGTQIALSMKRVAARART